MHRLMGGFKRFVAGGVTEEFLALTLLIPFAQAAVVVIGKFSFGVHGKDRGVSIGFKDEVVEFGEVSKELIRDRLVILFDLAARSPRVVLEPP